MNSNQSQKLTQKQKELVKRLENIRSNRDGQNKNLNEEKSGKSSTRSQRRNENTMQNQDPARNKRKNSQRPRTQTTFGRPIEPKSVTADLKEEYQRKSVQKPKKVSRPKKEIRSKKRVRKEGEHLIKQLSNGKKLSQAIILSEILDKPVALRRK